MRKGTPEYRRRQHLRARYGIDQGEYEVLWQLQQGKCAICGTDERDLKRRLQIDHDHVTGRVRGLLCQPCNVALGSFREDANRLTAALSYLSQEDSNA